MSETLLRSHASRVSFYDYAASMPRPLGTRELACVPRVGETVVLNQTRYRVIVVEHHYEEERSTVDIFLERLVTGLGGMDQMFRDLEA